jgi:hypothetical protein
VGRVSDSSPQFLRIGFADLSFANAVCKAGKAVSNPRSAISYQLG